VEEKTTVGTEPDNQPEQTSVEVTDIQRQRWQQLSDRAGRAWLDGDPDAQRAANDEQLAYAEELGPQRAEALRHAEQAQIDATLARLREEQAPVEVSGDQRQRWQQLLDQANQARRSGDPDAQRAAENHRRAYTAELGPSRVEVLQQELFDRLDQRRAERNTNTGWWGRTHGKLTDAQLEQAVLQAEHKRAEHRAAAERARATLAETEPAVAEGRGPAVTQLDATLARLRRQLELHSQADDVDRRWNSALTQASMLAAQARTKQIEAAQTRWYRSGLHDRRLAEAAELQARSEQARAAAEELGHQRAELHEQTGGQWSGHTAHARNQVKRAEATYGPDLEAARHRDQAKLDELRRQINTRARDADTTGDRRDALTAEHQLRAEMPSEQAATENELRTMWNTKQAVDAATSAVEERQRAIDASRDYHYDPGLHHARDHGLGL
jgi:hypothetical protein